MSKSNLLSLNRKYQSGLLSILIFLTVLVSCRKSEDEIVIPDKYLVDAELVISYSSAELVSLFNLLEINYPEAEGFSDYVGSGADIYNVKYRTRYKGDKIIASGLVCVPDVSTGAYPLLSFQNGTNTSDALAPTNNVNDLNFRILQGISGMGYVVLIPDYIGFGASSDIVHPYLHAESTVDAVVDLINAVKEFINGDEIGITLNNNLFLFGYSQGGWATMHVHKYLETYPGLNINVKASSCGAGSYNINLVKDYIFEQTTYPQPYYLAYVAYAYKTLGIISEPLSSIFKEEYADLIPSLFDGSLSNSEVNSQLEKEVARFLTDNILKNFETDDQYSDFREAITDNSVTAWNTDAPIKLFHGTADEYVPYYASESIYNDFMDMGVSSEKVELISLEGKDHITALIPVGVETMRWFNSLK